MDNPVPGTQSTVAPSSARPLAGQPSQLGEKKVLRQFDQTQEEGGWGQAIVTALAIVIIVAAGVGTGYFLSRRTTTTASGSKSVGGGLLSSGVKESGVKDEDQFPDKAEGRLEVNDFSEVEEGSHRLLRTGGPSQTAYLTSSLVDLSQFEGKCVELMGETFASQKAGWLMDVGWVKVLDKCPEGV